MGTNWKTRPNQATPTIQWVSIRSDPHILMSRQRIITITQVIDHRKQMRLRKWAPIGKHALIKPHPQMGINQVSPYILLSRQRIITSRAKSLNAGIR